MMFPALLVRWHFIVSGTVYLEIGGQKGTRITPLDALINTVRVQELLVVVQ